MNRNTIIIIVVLIVSFLGMLAGFYFFYPHLNEEKFAEITSPKEEEETPGTSLVGTPFLRTYDDITREIEHLLKEQIALQETVDSLNNLKAVLTDELAEIESDVNRVTDQANLVANRDAQPQVVNEAETGAGYRAGAQPQAQQPQNLYAAMETVQYEEDQEAFADRVKSLLNLDEEELAPILSRLNNDQLIKLYRSAGNIQREKLLRSLNPDRAARLMESIML